MADKIELVVALDVIAIIFFGIAYFGAVAEWLSLAELVSLMLFPNLSDNASVGFYAALQTPKFVANEWLII